MSATSRRANFALGAAAVLTVFACAPAARDEAPLAQRFESLVCSADPDKVEAVSSYDGTMGVSIDFVREHSKPLGGEAPLCPKLCAAHCAGILIGRDLLLTDERCAPHSDAPPDFVFAFGFGWPEVRYKALSVVEASVTGYAIVRLEGSPGDVWGVARLSALPVPAGQLVVSIFRSDGAPPQLKTGSLVRDWPITAPPVMYEIDQIASSALSLDSPDYFPDGAGLIQASTGAVIGLSQGGGQMDPACGYVTDTADPVAYIAIQSPMIRNLALDASKVSVLF